MKIKFEKRNSESGKRKPSNGARRGATRPTKELATGKDLAVGQHEKRERDVKPSNLNKELDRQDACPTTRRQLVAVLEEYGVSVRGFDGLRSDTYEKQIAARSLAELEGFYRTLMEASGSYEEKQKLCPVWNRGGKCGDKLPDIKTLCNIKERIMLDQAARVRVKARRYAKARQEAGEDEADRLEEVDYLKEGIEIVGEELLVAKLEGKPVGENLRMLDRMLKMAGVRIKERREARETARFDWERGGREIEQKPEPPNPAYKAVRLNKAEREVLDSLRIMCLTERIYGQMPEEHRQGKIKKMVDRMKTCVEEDPTIKRVPSKRKGKASVQCSVSSVQPETGNKRRGAKDAEKAPKSEQRISKKSQKLATGKDLAAGQKRQQQELATGKSPEPAGKNACPTSAEATKSGKGEGQNAQGAQEPPKVAPIPEKTGAQISAEAEERRQQKWREWHNRQNAQLRAQANEGDGWFNPYA